MVPHTLISVIIPVYNGELYLSEALESVLAQTYQPLDIIVVNDGSTDRSADILATYGRAIRWVQQPNQGTGAARNHGVSLAQADYLAFLDQDDVWASDKLAAQMETLLSEPTLDMVFGQVQPFFSPEWEAAHDSGLYCAEQPVNGYSPSALLIRRSAFVRVGEFETGWQVGEWAQWYTRARHMDLAERVLPQVVAWRRLHAGNKGLVRRSSAQEYARILHASLKRRRQAV
jgi:glycosyltransferase involved in cell wall biosynthesis